MSPFWILLQLRMVEVMVTTGAVRLANLQSNRYPHKSTPFLQAGYPVCRQTNGVKALNGKISHFMDLLTPRGLPA